MHSVSRIRCCHCESRETRDEAISYTIEAQIASGTVSKFGTWSKSCHDLGSHVFRFPHPNPLPGGEREPLVAIAPFPRPLGEGHRVRVFVLRCQLFCEFRDSFILPVISNRQAGSLSHHSLLVNKFRLRME